jgi:protein TonB
MPAQSLANKQSISEAPDGSKVLRMPTAARARTLPERVGVLNGPILPAVLLAALVSAGLFSLMYSVISRGHRQLEKAELLPTIDFVRLKRDTEVESMARHKPPPPPSQPPPPARLRVAADAAKQDGPSGFAVPNLGLSASVSGGPIAGQMGGGGATGMFDGDILPLQRIPPQYPRDAARSGITGWVLLEVMVNADGTVRSARVVDAKPRGVFEAAAVAAVMRWKFKPKVLDGKPVEQRGSQKIDFGLNSAG